MAILFFVMIAAVAWCACTAAESAASGDAPPPLDEVARRLAAAPRTHPRLLGGAEAFARVRDEVVRTPEGAKLARLVLEDADAMLDLPPVVHEKIGVRLLQQSRRMLRRATTLGMAWQLVGDEKYARRLARELDAAAAFPDWNPSHFLDTAEMAMGVALGYDWIHDRLDDDQRLRLRAALRQKGLDAVPPGAWWIAGANNWNQVCHAGLAAAALILQDDDPDAAARVIHRAVRNLPHSMAPSYDPDGAYPEGPGYWEYGTSFNVLLFDMLEHNLGTEFGLSKRPGFDRTVDYLVAATGPTLQFYNYADCPDFRAPRPMIETVWWFAKRYRRPDWARFELPYLDRMPADVRQRKPERGDTRLLPLALLWHSGPAASPDAPRDADAPVWKKFGGVNPFFAYRASPAPDALYLAAKAGKASISHGHMDAGSFILENDGVRWAIELGMHDYERLERQKFNLWNADQNGTRWDVLRYGNLSHNTVTIDGQRFNVDARAEIADWQADPAAPRASIDLGPVLAGQAASARRTFAIDPAARAVTVSDRLEGVRPGAKVRWGMATRARPRALDRSTLVLEQDGRTLTLSARVGTGEPPRWTTADLENPADPREDKNPGVTMVCFEAVAPESGAVALDVRLAP